MGFAQLLLPLVACVAFSNGAAIQSADMSSLDSLINMFVSNIENLDGWASSMGLTRNKREVTHGDYTTYNYKGIKVGYKVGEAFIHIDNLKAMVPAAHSKEVEVHVHFDGGENLADGLFEFEIDYFLTHFDGDGKEEGKLNLKRTMKNGKFVTALKTTAPDFDGETIIPAAIRNVDLELSSDRATFLHVKYVNPYRKKNTDLTFTLLPGAKPGLQVQGTRAGKKVDIKVSVANLGAENLELKFEGTTSGHFIISKQKIELNIGNEAIFQLGYSSKKHTITINTQSKKIKAAVKNLNVMNHIEFPLTLKMTELKFKNSADTGYKITEPRNKVDISLRYDQGHPGNFGAKASRGGKLVWKIGSKVSKYINDDSEIVFKSESNIKFADKNSKLYQLIDTYYPFGGFMERKATVDLSVDKTTMNYFFPKFNLHASIVKDGKNVFDLVGNTMVGPYKFSLVAPNLRKFIPNRGAEGIEVEIDHVIGKSLNIKSNGFGGLEFDAKRSANANGGHDVHVAIFKAKVKMLSYDLHTTFVNNKKEIKFTLNGKFHLDKDSLIYKNIVSNYKILTPFNDRVGNINIFVDKINKNVVLNKFRITADTIKDGKEVLNIIADTTKTPYKFKVFAPEIRNRFGLAPITNGNQGIIITVEHKLGDYLEVIANLKNWSGMKIVTKGAKKDVFWNGKALGEGEFEVGDNYIMLGGKKKGDGVILKDGDNIKVKLSLEGKNPLNNKLIVDVKGNKRNLDATLEWDVSNLDFDIDTPSSASLTLKAKGNNPRLGVYTLNREGELKSEGHIVHVTWTGDASWGKTKMYSPIKTDFDFSFDADKKDLVGTFSKTIGGKLYSIKFPKGTGATALPQITMG